MLLSLGDEGRLAVDTFVSHRFELHDMLAAYDTFGRAAETRGARGPRRP
jgi:alcohol dehydrogenase